MTWADGMDDEVGAQYLAELGLTEARTCAGCGCDDLHACPGGCTWATLTPPTCSRCAGVTTEPLTEAEFMAAMSEPLDDPTPRAEWPQYVETSPYGPAAPTVDRDRHTITKDVYAR